MKTGAAHALDWSIHQLHFVELFFATFRLGTAGGAGSEPVDVGLLGRYLFLLPVVGSLSRLQFLSFLFQMGGVVAQIGAGDPPLSTHNLIADAVEERAVVADHHQGRCLLGEVALKPLDGLHIEVVRGFIQQQKIGILQQNFSKCDSHLPAAGVVGHGAFGSLWAEANGGKQLVDPGFEFVAMERLKSRLQPAEFVNQLVEMLGIFCRLFRAHLGFHLALSVQHLGCFPEGLE